MTKRPRMVWMVVLFLVLTAGFFDYSLRHSSDPFWKNVSRIKVGMTLQEVESLLGGAAHKTAPVGAGADLEIVPGTNRAWMYGKGNEVMVAFDTQGRVVEVFPLYRSQQGLFDRLRAWLGW